MDHTDFAYDRARRARERMHEHLEATTDALRVANGRVAELAATIERVRQRCVAIILASEETMAARNADFAERGELEWNHDDAEAEHGDQCQIDAARAILAEIEK